MKQTQSTTSIPIRRSGRTKYTQKITVEPMNKDWYEKAQGEQGWENMIDKMLEDYADNVASAGDPKRTLGTNEVTIKEYISNLLLLAKQQERAETWKEIEKFKEGAYTIDCPHCEQALKVFADGLVIEILSKLKGK